MPSKSDPIYMKLLQNNKMKIVPERQNSEKGDACDVVKTGRGCCGKASHESSGPLKSGRPGTE